MPIKLNDLPRINFKESKSDNWKSFEILGINTVAEEMIKGIEIFVSLTDAE